MKTLSDDIRDGFKRYPLAASLAREDLLDRYRRSLLGIAWIILSFLLFIVVKAVIFSDFFASEDYDFFSHLVIGFAVFSFMSAIITQGSNLFYSSRTWILSSNTPYSVYIHSLILRAFIELGLLALTSVVLIVLFGHANWQNAWMVLPAFLLYYLTAFGICLLTAPIAIGFKDLVYALQAIMRVTFFATPIIWVAEPDTLRGTVAQWNPLTYYIDLIRVPLLEGAFPLASWLIAMAITSVVCVVGAFTFNALKPKVAILL